MLLWYWILCMATLLYIISPAEAGYCKEGYKCSSKCSRQSRYTTKCGLFGWKRCTRYRTKYYTCDSTCYRNVCCKGYTGSGCNTPMCFGSTSCLHNNPCTSPDRCSCKTGYKLPRCADINECSSNNGGCQHVCTNNVGSFRCSCRSGYTLKTDIKTCEDINECAKNNGGCAHTCTNKPGSHQCSCRSGYALSANGRTCTDINECSAGTSQCAQKCANTVGSYTCSCNTGYQLHTDGRGCADINECSQTPCDQTCTNTPGSFTCGCEPGYALDPATQKCKDANECNNDNGGCSQICSNTAGSYHCSCRNGFVLHTDGKSCTDIDECTEGTSQCSQVCINNPGSYTCGCFNGYKLAADGFSCTDVDDCANVKCLNGGVCIDNIGSYTCSCANGFTGLHCGSDINECTGFLNGGCEDVCINTAGSFTCKCTGNKTLQSDGASCSGSEGPSVFSKYGLVRRFLPRGCSTILLAKCDKGSDINVFMSSTSKWYQLRSDPTRIYTYGIVFVEVNSIALPVSISGMELVKTATDFDIKTGSLSLDILDGDPYGEERTLHCWSFDISPRDIRDFLASNSFLSSFFHNIEKSLPDWLGFSPTGYEVLGVNDLQTELSRGDAIQQSECKGAPLFSDRLYTVLKFGNSFSMSLYGQKVTLPKAVNNKKFCIIVDICQDYGGSIFLILPEESRDILDRFDMFKKLIDDSGVYIRPLGVGLSILKHINVHAKTTHLQQWNGDEIIQYPVFQEANLWIGGKARMETDIFRISGEANAFLSIPSPANILKSLFQEEWGFVVRMQAIGALEFNFDSPVGKQTIRGTGSGEMNALASLGGTHQRRFCGRNANPAGIFLSILFKADAFLDAPILRFVKPGVNVKAYAFLASDPKSPANNMTLIDILKEVLDLKHTLNRFVNFTENALTVYTSLLSNHSIVLLNTLKTTGLEVIGIVDAVIKDIDNFNINNLQQVIQRITNVWRDGWKKLSDETEEFIDSVKENTRILKYNITQLITEEINAVRMRVNVLIQNVTEQAASVFKVINGAGFRFKGSIDITGLKIIGLEIELVYSIDSLGACGRFERAYRVLKGEKSVRIYGVVSTGLIPFNKFLRMDVGAGVGLAISLQNNGKFAALLHVEAKILGIRGQIDIFITNAGIHYYIEGNVWNTFKAQLEVSAALGSQWHQLSFNVKGQFVADANGDGTFDDSYLAALRRFTKTIADEADKRISKLQQGVTKAQKGLTSAQDWLEDKKSIFRNANSVFDSAVRAFDRAKDKLEEAKKPFKDAINKLNEAKRKVDRLCKIKKCKKICIPGIKCRICHKKVWGAKIPYPCCKFTSCMISFPDPICVALNLLCKAARGIAYLALEAAKIFVRIPMLALDAAKFAVSAAQFVVDKSRVVLDIAVAALDLAKLGLEAAKVFLEQAKLALEAVKQVIKLGVAALNFVIKYGIESIIDVRNCGFEVTLSTHDLAVFDVHCEVNAFKTGFKTVRIRINFKDIVQSLWYAAKATIEAVLKSIGNIFGRRRREIQYESLNLLYKHFRQTRDTHGNASVPFNNQTIDTIPETLGFKNNQSDEYRVRTEIFSQKCMDFNVIFQFLKDTTQSLLDISNETAQTVLMSTFVQDDIANLQSYTSLTNASLLDLGINPEIAESEFNISISELNQAIENSRANLAMDSYLTDITRMSSDAVLFLQNQTEDANKINIVKYWITAMENITVEFFHMNTCVSFLDCTHHSVAMLYEMTINSDNLPNKALHLHSISAFEDVLLELTGNYSLTVTEVYEMSLGLNQHLEAINESSMVCSTPPTAMSSLENQTISEGQRIYLVCNATGFPTPTFSWFKGDEQLTNSSDNMALTILNATKADEGNYYCVASNLVASLTIQEAYVTITDVCESKMVTWLCETFGKIKSAPVQCKCARPM